MYSVHMYTYKYISIACRSLNRLSCQASFALQPPSRIFPIPSHDSRHYLEMCLKGAEAHKENRIR